MKFSRRSAPHLPLPPLLRRQGRDLIIATPHRERVSKGRGRARPFPLDAFLHSAAVGKSNPAGRQHKALPSGRAFINSER